MSISTPLFIKQNWRFLSFGFFLMFFCNLGQTFFIGFYNADIRGALDLSSGDFGALYGAATLTSAFLLMWVGRLIDHIDLRRYTIITIATLSSACFLMYSFNSISLLAVTIFLLRISGQGLMPHISNTSMGRYYDHGRGTALSLTQLGVSISQIILPIIVIFLAAQYGWRESWAIYGFVMLLIAIPLLLWTLKGHNERHEQWEAELALTERKSGPQKKHKAPLRAFVLSDWRFYCILPQMMAFPMFGTALFFFQDELLTAKGWPDDIFALYFPAYAICAVAASLATGQVIDRINGAHKLLPFVALPFCVGLLILSYGRAQWAMLSGLGLTGISMGIIMVTGPALLAEMYGTRLLGTVKSLIAAVTVFSTALTPAALGFIYDFGVGIELSYLFFVGYMALTTLAQIPLVLYMNKN